MSTNQKAKYYFKDGEEVCHLENTSQKMFVDEVVFKIYDRPRLDDPSKKESIKKIIGIRCHWWDKSETFHSHPFHKGLLLPYDIALGGTYTDNQLWLSENNS